MIERIRTVIATTLGVLPTDLSEAPSTDTMKQWDSLRHFMLMIAVEREFGIRIEPELAPSLTSQVELEKFVAAKLVVL